MKKAILNERLAKVVELCDVILRDESMTSAFRASFPKLATQLLDDELSEDKLESVSGGILIGLLLPAVQKARINDGGLHLSGPMTAG